MTASTAGNENTGKEEEAPKGKKKKHCNNSSVVRGVELRERTMIKNYSGSSCTLSHYTGLSFSTRTHTCIIYTADSRACVRACATRKRCIILCACVYDTEF